MSCLEEIEALIDEAKRNYYTFEKYLVEFSILIAKHIDNIKE